MTQTHEDDLRAISEAVAHLTHDELVQLRAALLLLFKPTGAPGNAPDSQTTEKD